MRAPMSARCRLDDVARLADGDFGSSAADIDVHDSSGFADRTGAPPEPNAASVASSASPALTDTNFPAWAANKSPMARAFAAPDGDPGEDERTRIDRLRIDTGERVLPVYEDAQGGRIDRHIVGRIFDERSEQDFGFVDDFALGYDIAVCRGRSSTSGKRRGARWRNRCRPRRWPRRISSSVSRLRLTLLKKILPPGSRLMLKPDYFVVGATYHPGSSGLARRSSSAFPRIPCDERVLHPVRNGKFRRRDVDRGVVGVLLARRTGVAPGVVAGRTTR